MKHLLSRAVPLFIVAMLAFSSQPTFAQDNLTKRMEARFNTADNDHDGKLSKAEAQAGMPRVAQYFEKIDVNNTGFITFAQITAFMAQQKK